jgi:Predicted ATPase (AAA+ superfamily)
MYIRKQLFKDIGKESAFLWGVRQTGKSTLLKKLYPEAFYLDLLLSDEYERFLRNPSLIREILTNQAVRQPVIIDEIQRIPALLNEVHWLIVNRNIQFILSGSSPRKILRLGGNLLGGRALRYELYPLVSAEIPGFDLLKALYHGLLPRHYLASNPDKFLSSYIGSYLRDEIIAEARIRNISSFSRFLEAAAFSNGEIVNFSNIATDCGVSSPTVKEYFQILEDTMTGMFVPSYQKKPKRRVITAPRFYYFDVGIAGFLLKRGRIKYGSESFGKAFEHFIFLELIAYSHYSGKNFTISYWRTASQIEVDFILGDHEIAIEVKSTDMVNPRHLKGLKSFSEEYKVRRSIVISTDPYPRLIGNIEILPWKVFLEQLWVGSVL